MKKILFTLVVALFSFSSALQSQRIAVKVEGGCFFPVLTQLKGEIPNCHYTMRRAYSPDIGVEYIKPSGLIFSATIGSQTDCFDFSERIPKPAYSRFYFTKAHRSVPFILSAGYTHGIGKSHFHVNALAGIGLGMVRSNDVSRDYFYESGCWVTDEQGQQHVDWQHVKIVVVDKSTKKLLPQARISAALDYQAERFFVRAFVEARSWLGDFGEIEYHSENSSSYFQFSQVSDGHFSIRAGYFGAGIGLGWYFNT